MKLIDALASGIRGAENGHAEIYRRGTSTRATLYADFEGEGQDSTGANVTLDANGGAVVFTDEVVTVLAKDTDGNLIREFSAGEAATSIEVRSTSFTGADYATLITGGAKPTLLSSVLDKWIASAGPLARDWTVQRDVNQFPTTLKRAISRMNGPFIYNVTADEFGAQGDGSTDDLAAIQAAIDAAYGANGGVVYFPAGIYHVNGTIALKDGVDLVGESIVGAGHSGAAIIGTDPTVDIVDIQNSPTLPQSIDNLLIGFDTSGAPSTKSCISAGTGTEVRVRVTRCLIGTSTSTGTLVLDAGLGRWTFSDTYFEIGDSSTATCFASQFDAMSGEAGAAFFTRCSFVTTASNVNVGLTGILTAPEIGFLWCVFDVSGASSGTSAIVDASQSNQQFTAIGCRVLAPSGGTFYWLNFGTLGNSLHIYEEFNDIEASALLVPYRLAGVTGTASGQWSMYLGSRENRSIAVTTDDNPHEIDVLNYGQFLLIRSTNGNQTLTANFPLPTGSFTLITKNTSGGASGTETLSTNFYPGSATYSIATNNKIDVRRFRGVDLAGTVYWVPDSTPQNNI